MADWDQAAAESLVHLTGVDVRACELCEGSGCIRESDLPRGW